MKSRLWKSAVIFALISTIYILAIGPIAELIHKRYIPPRVILIYWPVVMVSDYVPGLGHIVNAYIAWWAPLDD